VDDAALRREIGVFLRARREAIRPDGVGVPAASRRRTPGLRREEVAALSGVGITWYTWLEQGREINASISAMRRIARALQLTPTDESYLLSLMNAVPPPPLGSTSYVLDHAKTLIRHLRDMPALLVDARLDVLSYNGLADAVFDLDADDGPFGKNTVWRLFTDPSWRTLFGEEWEGLGRRAVGILRMRYATHRSDPAFDALLDALRTGSFEFTSLWKGAPTAPLDTIELRLNHPRLGVLTVASVKYLTAMQPEFLLVTMPPTNRTTSRVFARNSRRG
jgi:transcriptional regulator with XRE-family HTH domain